jgi:hypothetical protein
LTAGTTYDFAVKAFDAAGNLSGALSQSGSTLPASTGGNGGTGSGSGSSGTDGSRVLSDNAELRNLQVFVGGKEIPLTPAFAAGTLAYSVETVAEEAEMVANAAHSAAKITLNGGAAGEGMKLKLQEGSNVFELVVQSENGTKKTYTVTIQRKAPEPGKPANPNGPSESSVSFSDIAGHWSEAFLKQAVAKRIVSGYPDQTFRPDNAVTRAEFTVMLANALKLEETDAALSFTDSDSIGNWAKQAIAQAVKAGIVDGFEDGSFRPEAVISRAEMAAMIARALGLPQDADAATDFADDGDIPQWAKGAVKALSAEGIVEGRGSDGFVPNGTATRAESAVILLRMLEIAK